MEFLIVVGADVPARKVLLDPGKKLRVDGHHVFVVAVNRAILHHPDLAVALDDAGFDLAHLLAHERLPVLLPANDLFARFLDAPRTQRVGLAWPSQRRLGLLPGLQERFVRPLGGEGRIGAVLVEKLDSIEAYAGREYQRLVEILHQPLTFDSWHLCLTSLSG